MALIPMDMYLDGSDSPSLMHFIRVLLEVGHCGVGLDVDNTLADGTAAVTFFRLTILANNCYLLLLHGSACLLLHHGFDSIIVLLEADALHVRCDIRLVVVTQIGTHIQYAGIERADVVCVPPVVAFALLNVTRFDVVRCFGNF